MTLKAMLAAAMAIALGACASTPAPETGSVGQRMLTAADPTAALRDALHRATERVTVWYPAAAGAAERSLDMGPSGRPLFLIGSAAPDAAFRDDRTRPVILMSHGFGGTAQMMGWLGLPLARAGYVVIAVDHPGNNGADKMTPAGAFLAWDRAEDLKAALAAAMADPVIAPHLDADRIGVAGFSAGGFTALVSAGARVDMRRFIAFCRANPEDGVCKPQKEFPLTMDDAEAVLGMPELATEVARAGGDHRTPGVKAALAIAPALVQALPPDGLARMATPVAILQGDADPIAIPKTNARVAAKAIPGARLKMLPGVGHYDFLGVCTPAGLASVPVCDPKAPQEPSHKAAVDMALAFFGRTIGRP